MLLVYRLPSVVAPAAPRVGRPLRPRNGSVVWQPIRTAHKYMFSMCKLDRHSFAALLKGSSEPMCESSCWTAPPGSAMRGSSGRAGSPSFRTRRWTVGRLICVAKRMRLNLPVIDTTDLAIDAVVDALAVGAGQGRACRSRTRRGADGEAARLDARRGSVAAADQRGGVMPGSRR